MTEERGITVPQISLEFFTQEAGEYVESLADGSGGPTPFMSLVSAMTLGVPEEFRATTRIVFTGDFVQSVENRRTDEQPEAYSRERGSGLVAGKTMGRAPDGFVEVLFPHEWALLDADDELLALVTHLGAHEAVHVTLHHIGGEPFAVHKREGFSQAAIQYIGMAAEQVEEHLAEYLANQVQRGITGTSSDGDQLRQAFAAWQDALATQLPAIPEDDPDYFYKGMWVSFNALHILWKALAYLAAEVRDGDEFAAVPADFAELPEWKQYVEPWWDTYTALLGEIPMDVNVDVAATDEVVKRLALFLQQWALGLGFDHHDTDEGAWFRITLWD